MRKRLVILAAGTAGLMLAAVLALHTPWARGRALAWATGFLTRYDLELAAGHLSYNALTRRITVTDVRLAAKGFASRPFLVAARIDVQLPWSVYRRRFAIDHLTIDQGIVDIYRDANNIVNLPPSSNAPTPERARELTIRSLTLNGLDVQYEDVFRDWGVTVPRIESALLNTALGASGNFGVRGGLQVRLKQRTMTMAPFETAMTFDGSNVMLKEARLSAPELDAVLSGPISRVLDAPSLDLTIKGVVNLAEAVRWVPPPPVPVTGTATVEGTLSGPARNFVVDLDVRSNTLAVGQERDLAAAGPVRVTFDAFSGHDFVLTPRSGGSIRTKFNVPWGKTAISTAEAAWSGVDSQAALRLADVNPQAIGARFDGDGRFEFSEPRRYVINNRARGYARPGAVAATGTTSATITGDDYRYEHRHSFPGFDFEGVMSGRINHDDAMLSTMTGPAVAKVSDVAAAARSAATLGFSIADVMYETHGPVDAPLVLGGSYEFPEYQTSLTSDALDVLLLGRVKASATVVGDMKTATISKVDVRRGSAVITGGAVADITSEKWDGRFHVEAPNALDLQHEIPEAWRVSGQLTADATLGGTFDEYLLDSTINGTKLEVSGQAIDRATAKALVTVDAIVVSSLEAFQGAGYLSGRARYVSETGAYRASFKGDRLTWTGTVLEPDDTQAIFSIQFEGEGTSAQPRGKASLDFALTGGEAGTFIGSGSATADLLGDQAKVVARLPMIGALINADIATATPYDYRLSAQLDRFELTRLSPFMGAIETEVLGFANGTVTASGRLADDRDQVASINIAELDAGVGGIAVSLLSPLNATLRGDDLVLKDLAVRVGSGRLSAAGEWNTKLDGNFRAQFAGDFQDVIRLGKAFGVPVSFDGAGAMQFDLTSNGSRLGTSGTLSIKNGTFGWVGAPAAVQELTVNAALNGEQLTVERITGSVASSGVVGSFAAKGSARLPDVSLEAVDGAMVLDTARFTFSGIPVEQQRPSRVELSKGRLTMADVSWMVAQNPLAITGAVGLSADDPPLGLNVKGLIDLRVLSALTSTLAFDGAADVDTRIAGTVAKPLLDGRVALDGAEVAVADPRLVLSDLTGVIDLKGTSIEFNSLRGLANGGALALDGALSVEGMTLSGGALNIQAQGVAIELPKGLRSELDALVTFRPDARSPSLTGGIRIAQGAYTETITLAALARQAALPVVAAPAAASPVLDRLQLNLAVTTTDDIVVDNNYGRLAADVGVRVIGTASHPGMDGRVTLQEGGEIFLAGRTFRITRGDISFTDRRHIHPEFNIAADTNLGGGDGTATLTLTGTLERPTVDLTSENGGMTSGEIAGRLVGSTNTETALTLLSADLLGVTGRAIGLDAFRVERGDFTDGDFDDDPSLIGNDRTDPTTRLTVGKRLSDQVEFTVSQNLRENGKATFIVSYFPRRNVELRALSRDSGTVSVGIRHQITFGNGTSKPPSERRARPTISAITVSGVDAALTTLVREQIKLDTGDAFDFLELQKDVDRIRNTFHAQGFLEARVRTRRTESDDARTVTLEFIVSRGPRTLLQFDGFVAPTHLIEELEGEWHKNVFDQFLIDDLTHRVRRYLVTSGDLGSIVVGRIDHPAADTKRLRIDVTPGAPVTGREIRYAGNLALNREQLDAVIAQAGLQVEAWLDRSVIERALRQAYNEDGFLKAEVTGRPLTIDGTVGVLLIEIKEGPQAHITNVTWAGVGEARQADVQKAAKLSPPQPFLAGAVNDARRRVEDFYSAAGFNAAELEVEPAVAADDTISLAFVVTEGPQQVLAGVQISGNEVTKHEVLTEALKFELGKPVNLDEWALGRKRLYDTNVFRVVDIQPTPQGEVVDGVQQVKAVITVEEFPSWSLRYGFQFEGDRREELGDFTNTHNAGVVSEIRNPNLLGRALTGGVFGMYTRDQRDATVFLATSRLFGWAARSTLYGFFSRDRLRDDSGSAVVAVSDRQGISVDQRWKPKGFQIVYGYRFERNHTFDPDPGLDPFPLDAVANLAKLSTAVVFDGRDDPINSRKGFFSAVSFDEAALFLGSDVRNRKLLMQQFAFVPLKRVVSATRAQVGLAFGLDKLSFTDRFRAGGATSVRGYSEESLAGRDAAGLPGVGNRLIILNQELRFPLYRWANAVAFIDAGNIFQRGEKLSGLKVGYGVGLRFDTPVGLIRGDLGFPASALGTASRKPKFYFGLGHIF